MVRTRLRLSLFGGSKNPHGGKEVWSEPDFDLAYLVDRKIHTVEKKHGANQTSS